MARHKRLTKALGPENRSLGAVVPSDYTPPKDRYVKTLNVPCPTCHAAIGEPCTTTAGARRPSHPVRRRMALRAGW